MKSNHRKYLLALLGIALAGITSLAWTGNQQNKTTQSLRDTVPNRQKSSRDVKKDFDKEMIEIDRAIRDIRNLPDIDFSKIQEEIEASMKLLNEGMAKHKIDMEKMQKELHQSLSRMEVERIDVEKIKKEIEQAMEEVKTKVDAEKISAKIQDELSKVDMDKIKADMEKAREEMRKNKDKMKLDMDEVKKDLEKAKEELKGYQEMVYAMEKDGLIDTQQDYSIQYKNGEIFINGSKQSTQVIQKYKKYFSKDGVTIKKQKGEMNINIQ